MGQITIYLDAASEAKMRAAAQAAKLSNSKFIARLIEQHLDTSWPPQVLELAGAWPDFPDAETLRTNFGQDHKREDL